MPRNTSNKVNGVDLSGLDRGTYFVPGVGTVIDGKVLDGDDPEAVAAFHAKDEKARGQADEAIAERDAEIVAVVAATDTDDTANDGDKE